MSAFDEIQSAIRLRADLHARLSLIPYEGTPEVKDINGQKYLYMRKRVGSRLTSQYAGNYSEELHQLLAKYYEGAPSEEIEEFLKRNCWKRF